MPDETTICRFRQRMIAAGLHEKLLELLNEQLAAAGYLVKRAMLVDATLVESSRTRPEKSVIEEGTTPDRDARYAKKNGQSYYGDKAHISADGDHQLVCRALLTPANVDDSRVFTSLLEGTPRAVYADRMYDSARNRGALAERGSANGIMRKGGYHRPVPAHERARTNVRADGAATSSASSATGTQLGLPHRALPGPGQKPTRADLEGGDLRPASARHIGLGLKTGSAAARGPTQAPAPSAKRPVPSP